MLSKVVAGQEPSIAFTTRLSVMAVRRVPRIIFKTAASLPNRRTEGSHVTKWSVGEAVQRWEPINAFGYNVPPNVPKEKTAKTGDFIT